MNRRPRLREAAKKVQTAFQGAKTKIGGAAEQLVDDQRAKELLSKLQQSNLAGAAQMHAHLLQLFGPDPDEFLETLRERATQEASRHRRLLALGAEISRRMRDPGVRRQFGLQVLRPVHFGGALSSEEVWARVHEILGIDVIVRTHAASPGWTIGLGVYGEGGYGLGAEACTGIAGLRHHYSIGYVTVTVGIGAYVKGGGGVEVEFAPCTPGEFAGNRIFQNRGRNPARGWCVGFDIGGTYGVGGGISVAFTPYLLASPDDRVLQFDSIAVFVTAGASIEIAAWAEWGRLRHPPLLETPPPRLRAD